MCAVRSLDEPTNHLSVGLVDDLTRAFADSRAAIVVVTHDRQMRDDLAHWPRVELRGGGEVGADEQHQVGSGGVEAVLLGHRHDALV